MIDLLVAGGGPSGLATALYARRAGLEVVVVEPQEGVIDKACGEGLMPAAVDDLRALGVEIPRSRPFRGIRYVAGAVQAEADFPGGRVGLGVRRTVLHAALRDAALQAGARIVRDRVQGVEQHADHVRAAGLEARWLVAADGLRSPLRRALGLGLPPRRPARLGIRRHFRVAPWTDHVEVHWSDEAEAYVTPVDDELVGIAFLWRQGRPADLHPLGPFDRLLDGFPALAERLRGAAPASAVRGAGPFEQRVAARHQGRVLLVGDAAGYLDPLTGEGVRLGVATAEAAVRAIVAGDPRAYERDWRRRVRLAWWSTAALLWLAGHATTRRLVVPAAAHLPGVMRAAVAVLAA